MDIVQKIFDFQKSLGKMTLSLLNSSLFIFILILFLVFFVGFFVKIMYTKKKYGFNHFNTFKKRKKEDSGENMIYLYLEQLTGYKKYIQTSTYTFILIHQSGLYILSFFPFKGCITGSSPDDTLYCKDTNAYVENPFMTLQKEKEKITTETRGIIQSILITKDDCYMEVTDFEKVFLYKESKWVLQIEPLLKRKPIYTKEDIDFIYKTYNVK